MNCAICGGVIVEIKVTACDLYMDNHNYNARCLTGKVAKKLLFDLKFWASEFVSNQTATASYLGAVTDEISGG
jgi:hypothetical protein